MGLGQSRPRWNGDPRYPLDYQQYQHPPPPPFFPGYPQAMPVGYPQPMYPQGPQPGFIPPFYGQGAVLPPNQLHYFPDGRSRRHKTRRSTREDGFVGGFIQDQPSPLEAAPRQSHPASHRPREAVVVPSVPSPTERNGTRRAPTPFIRRMPVPEDEYEEEEIDRPRSVPRQSPIHYDQPATVQGDISVIQPMTRANRSAYGPSGPKPRIPLKNPLPPPPRDLYEMSPYKSLLTLPQTTALLTTTYGPQFGNVAPLASKEQNGKKGIFRVFSRKEKKPQPDQKNPVFIPVFLPDSAQNQPQQLSRQRSSTQPSQNDAAVQNRTRFQPQQGPFAGAGPNDMSAPTTAGPATGGAFRRQDDSSSVLSEALSLPIPPRPTDPPTIQFDQVGSYTQFMNHSPHRVVWKGLPYPTALHLHEALRFLDHRPDIAEQIRRCGSVHEVYPLTAKYVDQQRPDWGEQFLPLMEEVLYTKFRQHPDLRIMLLGTGHANLEYADPVDDYWGSGADGNGANQLGKVLTRVREQLREDSTP